MKEKKNTSVHIARCPLLWKKDNISFINGANDVILVLSEPDLQCHNVMVQVLRRKPSPLRCLLYWCELALRRWQSKWREQRGLFGTRLRLSFFFFF